MLSQLGAFGLSSERTLLCIDFDVPDDSQKRSIGSMQVLWPSLAQHGVCSLLARNSAMHELVAGTIYLMKFGSKLPLFRFRGGRFLAMVRRVEQLRCLT